MKKIILLLLFLFSCKVESEYDNYIYCNDSSATNYKMNSECIYQENIVIYFDSCINKKYRTKSKFIYSYSSFDNSFRKRLGNLYLNHDSLNHVPNKNEKFKVINLTYSTKFKYDTIFIRVCQSDGTIVQKISIPFIPNDYKIILFPNK